MKNFTQLAADASRFLQWFEAAKLAAEALAEAGKAEAAKDELIALATSTRVQVDAAQAALLAIQEKQTAELSTHITRLEELRAHISREQAAFDGLVATRKATEKAALAALEDDRTRYASGMAAERELAARLHEEQCARLNKEAADLEARVAAAREALAKITGAVGA